MDDEDYDKRLLFFFSVIILLITTVGGILALKASDDIINHNSSIQLENHSYYITKENFSENNSLFLKINNIKLNESEYIDKKYSPKVVQAAPENKSESNEIKENLNQTNTSSTIKWNLNGTKTVYLTSDNIIDKNTDIRFLKRIKYNLEKGGINVIMDPDAPNPNQVPRSLKSAPKDSVIVIVNFNCAGTIKDLIVGISGPDTNGKTNKGYLYEYAKDLKGIIYVNVSPDTILTNCSYLPRAWDDDFSPRSFEGLDEPADCLIDNGITLMDNIQPLHPIMGMKRAGTVSNRLIMLKMIKLI